MFLVSDIKQTRVYQEAKQEGREEGREVEAINLYQFSMKLHLIFFTNRKVRKVHKGRQ